MNYNQWLNFDINQINIDDDRKVELLVVAKQQTLGIRIFLRFILAIILIGLFKSIQLFLEIEFSMLGLLASFVLLILLANRVAKLIDTILINRSLISHLQM
ncbi:hypothetical protein [Shewanella marina]|uniref:hypothetical protein n=1 Tax=Shewanella marina TaxID=487319 RepID=UPI00046EDD19|nr:hypothetical protein [Shewanella marina]